MQDKAICVLLCFLVCRLFYHEMLRDLPPSPRYAARVEPTLLDPRRASWQELALLPGIGEALARRLVLAMENRRGAGALTEAELLKVKGLGPVRLQKILPHLSGLRAAALPALPGLRRRTGSVEQSRE